ncbi:HDOD domain-containing protein [Roseateles saccharophilus]|uniref:HD-like signal output (HDOD) protein n=1 Tax=Roseateles saccharophilus TaxID=304 RepID=A0A4R3UDW3_ROSSA|nr:HDOD domain-containing protein [Roseateles saccharophilus]MDG0835574.1 HDOD domain-containing protein [Roseateles saccharophilus]TCU85488.1 HD-like signal output (HDOD) protein [Roseateles saccharophilus]
MQNPASPHASPGRTQRIRDDLDQSRRRGPLQHIQIPPCPELLAQLQQAMSEPEPDLNLVARIASSDVAMAATLLRIANGPLFKPVGPPCATVGQAMTRIGLRESVAVMMGFLARHAIPVNAPQLARFWQRSSKRAIAMATIARQLPGLSPDLAHSFGLFLHVGMPVLLQSVRGYAATMVEAAARIDRPYIATENANHKTDHAVVGALVARVWNLSPTLMAAIRLHHDYAALGHADIEPEVHTLIAAGLIADHLMRRNEGLPEDADWAAHHADALAWLHVGGDELAQWEEAIAVQFDAD